MRIALFLLFGFLWFYPSCGQHLQVIDSLHHNLTLADPSQYSKILNEISWAYRKIAPDSTIVYANKAYYLAQKDNDYKTACKALSFVGVGHSYLTQLDSSLIYYRKALHLAESHGDSIEIAYGYNNIATFYRTQLDYSQAYKFHEMALEIFKRADYQEGMAYAYLGLARAALAEGNIEEAINFNSLVIDIRKQQGISTNYVSALLEMGKLLLQNHSYTESLLFLQEAKKYSEQLDNDALLSMCDIGIAELYITQERYLEALVYAKRAVAQYSHIVNRYEKYKAYLILGQIYLHLNDANNADYYLSLCLKKSSEHKVTDLEIASCQSLALLHEKEKDYAKSLAYYKRYLVGQETIFNQEKKEEVKRLHQNVTMMRKEQELENMRQREQRRDVTIKEEQVKTFFFLCLSSLALIATILFWRINRRQKKINEQLSEQKKRIEEQHTAIQQKNDTLERTNLQLSEINREKDSLMGVVAHDLKAPLNKVKGYTQILKLLGGMSDEQQKIVEGIDKVVENGSNLIRDLLDVHAIEYADSRLQPTELNMTELLADIVDGYEQAAEQKSITIIYTDPGHAVPIYSDEASLTRVFDNLISNAVKFSPKGKSVFISLHDNDHQIQVMIRDEGQGFSTEDQAKAFRKFQKLSARPTGGESSTGLGLAIVKVLVEKMQGNIQLYSEIDKGSEFIIELPPILSES